MAQAIAALGEACRIAAGLALGTEPTQAAWVDCMNRFAGWADRASDTVRGGPHRQDASAIPDPINQHIT